MNEDDRALIQSVCSNNLYQAKQYARIILCKNKAKSNEDFCQRMIKKLDNAEEFELPSNIKGLLFVENPQETMNISRYYLSEREKKVAESILKMNSVSQKLSDIGINYINSTILYGQSGTGKTTFGKYIAYKLGLPFAYLNFTRVIDSYLGATSKNLSNIFDFVRQWKCVLMLDEIDAIGMERGHSKEVGELSRIVIGLMQNLDNLTSDTVLISATNRIDILDKALLRRFTIKHEVTTLSKIERTEMAKMFFSDTGFQISDKDFNELVSAEDTQAGLMNRMVMTLVNYFVKEIEGKEK